MQAEIAALITVGMSLATPPQPKCGLVFPSANNSGSSLAISAPSLHQARFICDRYLTLTHFLAWYQHPKGPYPTYIHLTILTKWDSRPSLVVV